MYVFLLLISYSADSIETSVSVLLVSVYVL